MADPSHASDDRATVAERAARTGGERAIETFRTDVPAETKTGKTDLVTRADRDTQETIVETIERTFPDDPIVGEEGDELKNVPESGPAWVIDPIDGTNNYVRGTRLWATSVAATMDGEPVAAANVMPALGDAYLADGERARRNGAVLSVSDRSDPKAAIVALTAWAGSRRPAVYTDLWGELVDRFGDTRRYGSAQATLSYVASGGLEAVVTNTDPNPWDTLAGVYMIRRADGWVTNLDGDRWQGTGGFVASNGEGEIHESALEAAQVIRED
jgi:myo-inositol-1(or 4)-monophosphatase